MQNLIGSADALNAPVADEKHMWFARRFLLTAASADVFRWSSTECLRLASSYAQPLLALSFQLLSRTSKKVGNISPGF